MDRFVAIASQIVDDYGEDVCGLLPVRLQEVRKGSLSLVQIIKSFLKRYNGGAENREEYKSRCTKVQGVIESRLDEAEEDGEITPEERDQFIADVNFIEHFAGHIRTSTLGVIIAEATGYVIPVTVERPDLPPRRTGSTNFEEVLTDILEEQFATVRGHGMVDIEGFHVNEEGHLEGPEGSETPEGWVRKLTPLHDNGDGLSPEDKTCKGKMHATEAVWSTLDTKDNDSFEGQMSPDHPEYSKYVRMRHAGIINLLQNLDTGIRGKNSNDLRRMLDQLMLQNAMTAEHLTGGQKRKLSYFPS